MCCNDTLGTLLSPTMIYTITLAVLARYWITRPYIRSFTRVTLRCAIWLTFLFGAWPLVAPLWWLIHWL